ncbi:hypothetical protein [Pararhizobium gei]|uniref:hypothetical protein n=1 Tax=Pararhizobium gei TaxID=1395951 RepID=UPI0023DA4128|nr:hypothetical protein [Rhizobium gei]
MDLATSRLAVLRAQSNCPACGAFVSVHGTGEAHNSALFKCGAIFDVRDGEPLTVLKVCPAPSNVAVAQLNRQAETLAADTPHSANQRNP